MLMRPINRCLNNQLLEICQRAVKLDSIDSKLKQYLPVHLAEYCQAGSFNKGCLTITTTSAAWATELRYSLPVLRDQLRKEAGLYQLTSIKISIVDAQIQTCSTKPTNKITLSFEARHAIRTAGEQCDYLPLKEALIQLAEGCKNKS